MWRQGYGTVVSRKFQGPPPPQYFQEKERKWQQDACQAVVNGSMRDTSPEIPQYPAGRQVTIVKETTVSRVTTIYVPGGPTWRL